MKTICQQQIGQVDSTIKVPAGSKFLAAQLQRGDLCVWFLADPDQPTVERRVAVRFTGQLIPSDQEDWEHLSTYQTSASYVYHVFIEPFDRTDRIARLP